MFKIVASDLDGTLLNAEHVVAPYTKSVLQRLLQQGEHFVFATGRHHIDVNHIRKSVGIPAFIITSNGARIHDNENNLIFSKNVDGLLVSEITKLAQHDEKIAIHIFRDNDWLVSRAAEGLENFHKDSGFSYQVFDTKAPPTENIAKIFYISDDHEHLVEYERKLVALYADSISIAFSTPKCLEIMGAGVSKGAALEIVAKLKGLSLDECIAFGDGMNDIEMLQAAKKGLVMGNAPQRVKDAVPHIEVIGLNKDEAVAKYLAANLLK